MAPARPGWRRAGRLVPPPASRRRKATARPDAMTEFWYWDLPVTPNGLRPLIAYSGAGSAPDGSIDVAGMDQVANSALYRLPAAGGTGACPRRRAPISATRALQPRPSACSFRARASRGPLRPTWQDGMRNGAGLNAARPGRRLSGRARLALARLGRGRPLLRRSQRVRARRRRRSAWWHRQHRVRPSRGVIYGVEHADGQSLRL